MKLTRYEVESKVNEIAEENDVEKDFYGDCYPDEVMQLENRITLESNEEERNAMFDEIKEILVGYI